MRLLNGTLPPAFGEGRTYNFGLPPEEGAPPPFLQVDYEPLEPGPTNAEGGAWLLPIDPVTITGTQNVADRQRLGGRSAPGRAASGIWWSGFRVGARTWGDICVLAPRNSWLAIVRDAFEAAQLKTALQARRNRNGDNPVYAWMCGLLAVVCDPDNLFEWFGVLREVFAVSDSLLAGSLRDAAQIRWEEPENYPAPVGAVLEILRPFIERVDLDGESLGQFASDLAESPATCRKRPQGPTPTAAWSTTLRAFWRRPRSSVSTGQVPATGCARCSPQSTAISPPVGRRPMPST